MRTISKADKLNSVSYEVRGPVLEEAERMIARGEDILRLNIGNPAAFGFTTPEAIRREITDHLMRAEGYSDSKGLLSAREAVVRYCKKKGIPNVGVGDVYTGNGVSELTSMCMQGFVNSGDEILVPAPDYPLWTAAVTVAGGKAVHYICDEQSEWNPDMEDMKRKITGRTKGIVVINPNNPTGALYPDEILQQIVDLARQHDLVIFADEIYDRLLMDGRKHTSIASLAPDLLVITFNGLSKSHFICGFRCGWMSLSGDKSHASGFIEGINILSSMRLCSNVPAQLVIEPALAATEETDRQLLPGGRLYEQRETIYQALNDIPGVSAVKPKAGLYIFPKLDVKRFNITDDERFVLDFLHEEHILVVRGKGFNWIEPDHFRIVYLPHAKDLERAAQKLGNFLAGYRQKSPEERKTVVA
ncbi:pyridoxal phosphate-dependent aminotransferase [Papillibacter cinnamivorans]|uniref:alanine transaminase n=1 Tax=Papillibacter cinnamivorans DSM 12816 TaxID=1122930 RepID=A0A1W2AI19_9FIRM|nr:pyridoxal phosphate-dependent aminotransferase [Papillibacter cinnamivorans]SMC60264.1 alanine-synthesizing transaminase [Papillibacter cinnamivorans DSM 12816]